LLGFFRFRIKFF